MASVYIRERNNVKGTSYQVILDKGIFSDGKKKRESVTVYTKKEAIEMKAKLLYEYNMGTHIAPVSLTVKQLCEEWFKCHVTELAANTQAGYRVNLDNHIYPYIGDIKIQKLRPTQIKACYEELKKKGLSPRSIHYVHTTLHEALRYAYLQEIVPRNVSDFVTLPKESRYKPKVYNKDEIRELLAACKGDTLEVAINIAVALGLRRGEVLGLQWKDINFAESTMHICHNLTYANGEKLIGRPKTETSERVIVVPQSLIDLLKEHKIEQGKARLKSGSEYHNNDLVVCLPNGDAYNPGTFSKCFSNLLSKNDLPHCRFHDLRHANATAMLEAGVPMKTISQRLGHSEIDITMNLYAHVTTNMQEDAAAKINAALYGNAFGA